jgi:hypothetical protein
MPPAELLAPVQETATVEEAITKYRIKADDFNRQNALLQQLHNEALTTLGEDAGTLSELETQVDKYKKTQMELADNIHVAFSEVLLESNFATPTPLPSVEERGGAKAAVRRAARAEGRPVRGGAGAHGAAGGEAPRGTRAAA